MENFNVRHDPYNQEVRQEDRVIRQEERTAQYIESIAPVVPIVPLLPDVSVDISLQGRLGELRHLAADLQLHAQELMQPNPTLGITARAGSLNSIAAQILAHIDQIMAAANPVVQDTPAAYGEFGAEFAGPSRHRHHHHHKGASIKA
jgi:hypothetical protein